MALSISQGFLQGAMGGIEVAQLVKRLQDLEVSQAKLEEKLKVIVREGVEYKGGRDGGREEEKLIPGFFATSPYYNVLQCMGHALHVFCPDTGEIVCWNQSAENLYGWKDSEALGQRIYNLIMDEKGHPFLQKVIEKLSNTQPWLGQLPCRKKSGETFMALVTKSPLYEDGKFVGIILVSSDAAMFNNMSLEIEAYRDQAHDQPEKRNTSFRRVQWRPQQQVAMSRPTMASKIFSRSHANSDNDDWNFQERCERTLQEKDEQSGRAEVSASKFIFRSHVGTNSIEERTYKYSETVSKLNQGSKIAAKVFAKLNVRGNIADHVSDSEKGTDSSTTKILACNSTGMITKFRPPILAGNSIDLGGHHSFVSRNQLYTPNTTTETALQLVLANNR